MPAYSPAGACTAGAYRCGILPAAPHIARCWTAMIPSTATRAGYTAHYLPHHSRSPRQFSSVLQPSTAGSDVYITRTHSADADRASHSSLLRAIAFSSSSYRLPLTGAFRQQQPARQLAAAAVHTRTRIRSDAAVPGGMILQTCGSRTTNIRRQTGHCALSGNAANASSVARFTAYTRPQQRRASTLRASSTMAM